MYRGAVPGYVVLADGTVYSGFGFGAGGEVFGEIVFNTGMTGYQEVVTDPSYHGQLITFTYPLIGNYGVSPALAESELARSRAVIVREAKNTSYNATCPGAWVDWLSEQGVVGVGGVDTRALTRRIREQGAMTAVVATGVDVDVAGLVRRAAVYPSLTGRDLVREVSCSEPYEYGPDDAPYHVVAFDYGIKRSILRRLQAAGCRVTVVPAHFSAEQALGLAPDGVFLSNGPGDPEPVDYAVQTIRALLGAVPVFGICLGHQLLSLALGLQTYKLKFGHRGINHPVKNFARDFIEITSQNHGFAVRAPSVVEKALRAGTAAVAALSLEQMSIDTAFGQAEVTHLNLNDGTVEGLRLLEAPAFCVQYHPEAGPGPHDSRYLFADFVESMSCWRAGAADQ
jgi:carbamoyl-phosphate synthase small subunit